MTNVQYAHTQKIVVELGVMTQTLDLDTFIERISTTQSLAPALDPTAYRQAATRLQAIKKIAEALKAVREATQELQTVVIESHIKPKIILPGGQ